MSSTAARKSEFNALVLLALPLCATHVGLQLMSFVDTAVVGRLGAVPLAGVGLANGIYMSLSLLGIGAMMGLDPLVAQALGAGNPVRARQLLWQSVYLSALVTIALIAPIVVAPLFLVPFGIEA